MTGVWPARGATLFAIAALVVAPNGTHAQITDVELAGNALADYPFFEYVRAINEDATVEVAIDPTRFPGIAGATCDIYVVASKTSSQWSANPTLVDVTPGGPQTEVFAAGSIQANTFAVAAPFDLSANAGAGLGVGYDVVLDCDQDGSLSSGDYVDGRGEESGFYAVHDTSAPGPFSVTELTYNLSNAVAAAFSIPVTRRAQNLFDPDNIALLGRRPIVVVGHGNGHQFEWYDHIGEHLASYGYVVMSHDNNTVPGPFAAASTTLGHTDAFIDQVAAGAIAAGALVNHIDTDQIVWIGHSRGAEGVAIAYDRLVDGSHVPTHYGREDIKLISSMLPTDFRAPGEIANPHDANYHLWTAAGDTDVRTAAGQECCQTFRIHDRATHYRLGTVVQGVGHAWFHNGPEMPSWFAGPCSIGPTNDTMHSILLGHLLPLVKRYLESNLPALDFLTRQYEAFRPIGVPAADPCIVVTHQYRNGASQGNFIIDDYQSQPSAMVSSSGGAVSFSVQNVTEGLLDDNDFTFTWLPADPFNGALQGTTGDVTRGVVFDWTGVDRFYEWTVPAAGRDFEDFLFLSFRAAQGTQHPNTLAMIGDLTFAVTLRDGAAVTSTIGIGAYGGGLEQPYARADGGHNDMETIRIRLTDFLNNGSGLDLSDIVAVRLDVGPSWGSAEGRIVVDDLMLTNDVPPGVAAPGCECEGQTGFTLTAYGGLTIPHGTFATIADPSISLGIKPAVNFAGPFTGRWSAGVYLGHDRFDNPIGSDFDLTHVSGELEWAPLWGICPEPAVHGGAGVYVDESNNADFGWNLGASLGLCLTDWVKLLARYDYRTVNAFSREYSTVQLGLRVIF